MISAIPSIVPLFARASAASECATFHACSIRPKFGSPAPLKCTSFEARKARTCVSAACSPSFSAWRWRRRKGISGGSRSRGLSGAA